MSTPATQIGVSGSDLPTIQRLFSEDFKEAPKWFTGQFISTMNLFMQPVYNILSAGVDITQNTKEEFYTLTLTSTGSPTGDAVAFSPKKFVGIPTGVLVAQCYNTSAAVPTAIGNPVTIDWYFTGTQVKILAIYGLVSGQSYRLVLRIC